MSIIIKLNIMFEMMLGLETAPPPKSPEDPAGKSSLSIDSCSSESSHIIIKRVLLVLERIFFTMLSVGVSIAIPQFGSMMAFLGSFSAFMLCVIGPVSAKVALTGRCGFFDATLLVVATVMATWGTLAAFW